MDIIFKWEKVLFGCVVTLLLEQDGTIRLWRNAMTHPNDKPLNESIKRLFRCKENHPDCCIVVQTLMSRSDSSTCRSTSTIAAFILSQECSLEGVTNTKSADILVRRRRPIGDGTNLQDVAILKIARQIDAWVHLHNAHPLICQTSTIGCWDFGQSQNGNCIRSKRFEATSRSMFVARICQS